jgi:hypothetical protein
VIDTPAKDYGTDCTVSTFEPQTGLLEPDFFKVQLKASDLVKHVDGAVSFPADMRDLRDWERSSLITFLVVFDAKEERGWWLNIQDYIETSGLDPHTNDNATHVLHLPHTNEVSESAIAAWRDMKNTRNEQVRRLL